MEGRPARPAPALGEDPLRRVAARTAATAAVDRPLTAALWAAAGALALARLAGSTAPGAWGWGLATLRDVPAAAWALWALATVALVPIAARPAERVLAAFGNAWTGRGAGAGFAILSLAAVAAACVFALGDRGYFVGDFVLRLGSVRQGVPYAQAFPQALPLDIWLHEGLVKLAAARTGLDPLAIERAMGALRAAVFAGAGVALARAMGVRGSAAAVVTLGTSCTAALALCTGYGKGLADLCVVAILVAVFATRVARGQSGLAALGVTVAAGIGLHRSGLAFLAPWAVAVWVAHRRGDVRFGRWRDWLALVPPPLAAALVLPRLPAVLNRIDRSHFYPAGEHGPGPIPLALHPVHLADMANVLVVVAPLAMVALAAAIVRPRLLASRPEAPVLAALVAPWLPVLLLVHPRQGMVRDWDVFATAGIAIACASAAILGAALAAAPARRWLAPALALAAIAPVGSLLLRGHSVEHSLAHAQRTIAGPPARAKVETASLHMYRAIVLARDGQHGEGAREFGRAATLMPTRSHLTLWLNASMLAKDLPQVREALEANVRREPSAEHLLLLSRAEAALGHESPAREAARRAVEMAPGDTACAAWAGRLGVFPERRAADRGADGAPGPPSR